MDEKQIYQELLISIKDIRDNLKDAISYINTFNENIEQGLKIDDSNSFNSSVKTVKNNLDGKIQQLQNVIIPAITSKS